MTQLVCARDDAPQEAELPILNTAPHLGEPKLTIVPALSELQIARNARLERELGADVWATLTPAQQAAERQTLLRLVEQADEEDTLIDEIGRRGYTFAELDLLFPVIDEAEPSASAPAIFSDLLSAYANVGRLRPWFAEGAIEGTPIIMFSGPEKSHKSWTAMQLAVATVLGNRWLGQFKVKRPGPVVYLDGEYGEYEFTRRIARIARGMGANPLDVLPQIHHLYSAGLTLVATDPTLRASLAAVARVKPSLIVVDPLRNHLSGNENDAHVILDAFKCIASLRDAGKCPVMVLHHLNKSGGFTGSRAITTRADLIIEGSDGLAPSYSVRGRTVRPQLDPIAQPFTIEAAHENDSDDTIAATRITYAAAEDGGPSGKAGQSAVPPGLSKFHADIYRFLDKQETARSANYVAKVVGRSAADTKKALNAMTDAGHLEFMAGGAEHKGKAYDGWAINPDGAATPTTDPTDIGPDVGIDAAPTPDPEDVTMPENSTPTATPT